MDFQTLKRRDLQSLCKLNNIPANTTNAAMVDALASLPNVEGLEEFLAAETHGSPERSVITSSNVPGTTTTRTRCRTRTRVVEGTDTKKTPATLTTRKRATQEASVQKKMDKDLQVEFEADWEKFEVTENNVLPGGELMENSEEVSGLNVENGQLLEIQSEPQTEVQHQVNDGQEVIDLDDDLENEAQNEASAMLDDSKKVDFYSLSRKDLQNLCKKNKIPANMTNAAMADALGSLETVEGLQEFLKECESQAPSSPLLSRIASSSARRSRTTMKVTREEPRSSKLITKSCRGSRRRIVDETELVKNDMSETPAAPSDQRKAGEAEMESIHENKNSAVHKREKSEVSSVAEFIGDISNSLAPEAPLNESTFDGPSDVENVKEPEEMVSKIDENAVTEDSLESPEVTVLTSLVKKVDVGPEAVDTIATRDEDLKFVSADSVPETIIVQKSSIWETDAENEAQDGQLQSQMNALDSEMDSSLIEKLDNIHVDVHKSKEVVSGYSSQADQLFNLEINEDGKSGNTKLEKVVKFSSCSADYMGPVEKTNTQSITQTDELSLKINVDREGSCTEDEISDLSDYEPDEEISDMSDYEPDHLSLLTDQLKYQFDTESSIQVCSCIPTESKTPLYRQSLRKLKRMYKEKLQAKTLAKPMGKLSLDETEIPLTIAEENLEQGNDKAPVSEVMAKENDVEEPEKHTDNEAQSDDDRVEQDYAVQETLVTYSDVKSTKLSPVGILLDNEVIPEDAVLGEINVTTCPPQATPSRSPCITKKPLPVTPTKSSCKTPKSAGRQNRDLDVNKENIDKSASRTEPEKIKVAVTGSGKIMSAKSMGMLKKELQVLQSDKKKRALQMHSGNQCPLD